MSILNTFYPRKDGKDAIERARELAVLNCVWAMVPVQADGRKNSVYVLTLIPAEVRANLDYSQCEVTLQDFTYSRPVLQYISQ